MSTTAATKVIAKNLSPPKKWFVHISRIPGSRNPFLLTTMQFMGSCVFPSDFGNILSHMLMEALLATPICNPCGVSKQVSFRHASQNLGGGITNTLGHIYPHQ